MGDFLLDLRREEDRAIGKAVEFLQFYPDMWVVRHERPEFGLVLTSADDPELWGPYVASDQSLLVGLCGRIALTQREWDEAARVDGQGGLACRSIAKVYSEKGVRALEEMSGNFVILVYDHRAGKLLLITDRWGLVPAFRFKGVGGQLLYGSHPDAVANAAGEGRNWDLTSFAEFILAGRLSAPHTYYRRINALPVASTTRISLSRDHELTEQTNCYFQFDYHPLPEEKLDELAERFAVAFKEAVARRTQPHLGHSAVALSGGLDSRTVLCSVPDRRNLITFSCYDAQNREFHTARTIAREAGVEFVPLQRSFDYYGDTAPMGVKISAGMGCIASNHFLGVRENLRAMGVQNLLTGCYCDYLFKGLALNKQTNRWTTLESLNSFDYSYYSGHFTSDTELGASVRQRFDGIFPPQLRRYDSDSAILGVERRRVFPLCYEEDNAERTIPQRVMGWYVPIADNELMEVILSMSVPMKLNRRLFAKMVESVCGPKISRISDANTGAAVNAPPLLEAFHGQLRKIEALYRKVVPTNATSGSWLNWSYYAQQSRVVQDLWSFPNADALEVFRLVLGREEFQPEIAAYPGKRIYLFLQLLTLKLWFDQRCG